jgi:hypothetical protein
MNFVKSSIKNLTIAATEIGKVKELLKTNKEAESEIDSIVGVSNTLSFDGMHTDFLGREVGEFHIECFLVVKHYKNDRFESRVEYYVHSIRNEDNFELLDCGHSGYNVSSSDENIDYTNNQLEEFKKNYANEEEDVHLPFFSIYSK